MIAVFVTRGLRASSYTQMALRSMPTQLARYSTDPPNQTTIARWFYASDVPKARPVPKNQAKPIDKDKGRDKTDKKAPSKFVPFNVEDSARLEKAYQSRTRTALAPVLVKEDGLFQVDLGAMEITPVYWDGPSYEVRRGLWFYHNSGKPFPCSEQLSSEIESRYVQLTETAQAKTQDGVHDKAQDRPQENAQGDAPAKVQDKDEQSKDTSPAVSEFALSTISGKIKFSPESRSTAWITPDDSMTLQRLTSLGGTKVIRGFHEKVDNAIEDRAVGADGDAIDEVAEQSTAASISSSVSSSVSSKLSSLFDMSSKKEEDQKNKVEIEKGYNGPDYYNRDPQLEPKAYPSRPVKHLVLCVHGIGQRLARKIESINFVQDINVFRKSIKAVYEGTEEIQTALHPDLIDSVTSGGNGESKKNARDPRCLNSEVQVLPVLWRDSVTFGMSGSEKSIHPQGVTLDDVNVQGLMAIRNIVGDVILDVLLYKQPQYKQQIMDAVTSLINSTVAKFKQNNPDNDNENLKISLVGHSLGSAICFDILSSKDDTNGLDFEVENLYGIGSPQGLFKLIDSEVITKDTLRINGSYFNVFHPSDAVAYRVEPLIERGAAASAPAKIPYTKGGLTSQIQELSEFGQRLTKGATSAWSSVMSTWSTRAEKSIQEILTSTIRSSQLAQEEIQKEMEADGEIDHREPEIESAETANKLKQLNVTGRVDFELQEGVLDISLIAALASHVSYFENPDVANLVLRSLYAPESLKTEGNTN